jgi:hypothetical protein
MGFATNQPGALRCAACEPGRFANASKMAACDVCPLGRFQNSSQGTSCFPCGPGTSGAFTGLSRCLDCDVGLFQSTYGQSACVACQSGRAQNATGASACTNCSAGRSTALEGQEFCRPCAAGYFTDVDGADGCSQCPSGTYQGSVGATGCVNCLAGTYTTAFGQGERERETARARGAQRSLLGAERGVPQWCARCAPPATSTSATPPPAAKAAWPASSSQSQGRRTARTAPSAATRPRRSPHALCVARASSRRRARLTFTLVVLAMFAIELRGRVVHQRELLHQLHVLPRLLHVEPAALLLPLRAQLLRAHERVSLRGTRRRSHCARVGTDFPWPPQSCPTGGDCREFGVTEATMQPLPGYWRSNPNTLGFYRCFVADSCVGGTDPATGSACTGAASLRTCALPLRLLAGVCSVRRLPRGPAVRVLPGRLLQRRRLRVPGLPKQLLHLGVPCGHIHHLHAAGALAAVLHRHQVGRARL